MTSIGGNRMFRDAWGIAWLLLFAASGACALDYVPTLSPRTVTIAPEAQLYVVEPDSSASPQHFVVFVDLQGHSVTMGHATAERCSAVAVGDRVLLTAAHCVPKGKVHVRLGTSATWEGDCFCHPAYHGNGIDSCKEPIEGKGRSSADLALCELKRPGEKFKEEWIETISTAGTLTPENATVWLAGRGCTEWNCSQKTADNPGVAMIGDTRVAKTPLPSDDLLSTAAETPRDASLCPGDSGGPVFAGFGTSKVVVAIGKRGCVDNEPGHSVHARLAPHLTVDWMCGWVKQDPGARQIRGLVCSP